MPKPEPSAGLISIMALACGVGVTSLYFPQAITPLLARHFGVSEADAALVAALAQFGYAAGMFFILPLGDRLPRRPMVASMFAAVAALLLVAGTSSSLGLLCVVSVATGIATVVPQILLPMSADLAGPGTAGRVMATVSTGLLTGVLLSRAFGGLIGQWLGWRGPYLVMACLALILAGVLAMGLPTVNSTVQERYPALLATSARLFTSQPELRRSSLYQVLMFGAFSAAWTSIALYLTGPHFGYGTGVVGLVALVGAGSVLVARRAGRAIDRAGPDAVSRACFLGALAASAVLLTGVAPGAAGLAGLTAGMLLLDVCVQCSQIANQARVFALVPGARSRLNSAYMTMVFIGGSAGSWLGTRVYLGFGWTAVCALIGLASLSALARHALHVRAKRGAPAAPGQIDQGSGGTAR